MINYHRIFALVLRPENDPVAVKPFVQQPPTDSEAMRLSALWAQWHWVFCDVVMVSVDIGLERQMLACERGLRQGLNWAENRVVVRSGWANYEHHHHTSGQRVVQIYNSSNIDLNMKRYLRMNNYFSESTFMCFFVFFCLKTDRVCVSMCANVCRSV